MSKRATRVRAQTCLRTRPERRASGCCVVDCAAGPRLELSPYCFSTPLSCGVRCCCWRDGSLSTSCSLRHAAARNGDLGAFVFWSADTILNLHECQRILHRAASLSCRPSSLPPIGSRAIPVLLAACPILQPNRAQRRACHAAHLRMLAVRCASDPQPLCGAHTRRCLPYTIVVSFGIGHRSPCTLLCQCAAPCPSRWA